MKSDLLIQTLISQTTQIINQAQELQQLDTQVLTWRESPNSWSVLECLKHLNLYGDFYLPQIENKIIKTTTTNEQEFKSGFLGNYFAKSMLPKEKLNKMKTFKDKNPLNANLDKAVIDEFIHQQNTLLALLHKSSKVSLNKVKIETSISSLLKLKLGDAFQFYVTHMIRHMSQIDRVLANSKK